MLPEAAADVITTALFTFLFVEYAHYYLPCPLYFLTFLPFGVFRFLAFPSLFLPKDILRSAAATFAFAITHSFSIV